MPIQEALNNMLDLSGYEMEHCNTLNCTVAKDKYGINIGISEDNMKCNMFHDDVKCLRDIYGVGASTVSLIEEWIETGSMKRLENLRNEVDDTIREKVHYSLNFEDGKKDYTIDFVEALGKLADLYKEEEDHRATAFRRAIIALEPKIIHSVEDIETQKLIDLKGVGKSTLEMFKEFIETGKIEKLEEFQPKTTKEDWDAFIENHEPLRNYEHKKEFMVGMFPEDEDDEDEYEVWVTCIYHERSLESQLEAIIDKNREEYPDDLRWALTGNDRTYNHETKEYEPRNPDDYTIVYDIPKLKRCTEKFEFSEGDVHEVFIFEGYLIKNGTKIHTHPFKMGFSAESNAYQEDTVEALGKHGWTPPGFSEYLHEQLDPSGGWRDRVQEWEKARTKDFT